VAACGLPKERDDHAIVIVRFADECFRRMSRVTHDLEKYLGPSTGELKARCGIHTGPVTAGVLRGEKVSYRMLTAITALSTVIKS
jgi:class 3 adenylate cyclase